MKNRDDDTLTLNEAKEDYSGLGKK